MKEQIQKEIVKLLERLRNGEGEWIEGREVCDCGDVIRHNNGGNYHAKAWVYPHNDGWSLILGSTREDFPGDEWWSCEECGLEIRSDEIHKHYRGDEVEKAAAELMEWIKRGDITIRKGHYFVDWVDFSSL